MKVHEIGDELFVEYTETEVNLIKVNMQKMK